MGLHFSDSESFRNHVVVVVAGEFKFKALYFVEMTALFRVCEVL